MTIQVNQDVVTGFTAFPVEAYYIQSTPIYAKVSQLSQAENAPWTNRVPQHEPWPRGMMGNTQATDNKPNDECNYNTHHYPQFIDDNGGDGSFNINRVEGTDTLDRGQYWRR